MRIFEITDLNKSILAVSGIDFNIVDEEYNRLVALLTILIKLKAPSRNRRAIGNIQEFETLITKIFQNKMLDRTDIDIITMLEKIQKMQNHVNTLKSQLVF